MDHPLPPCSTLAPTTPYFTWIISKQWIDQPLPTHILLIHPYFTCIRSAVGHSTPSLLTPILLVSGLQWVILLHLYSPPVLCVWGHHWVTQTPPFTHPLFYCMRSAVDHSLPYFTCMRSAMDRSPPLFHTKAAVPSLCQHSGRHESFSPDNQLQILAVCNHSLADCPDNITPAPHLSYPTTHT